MAEGGTDEGGTGEASGQDDIQSSSDTCSHHSVEDYATSSSPSGMIFETCDRSVYLCAYV